MNLAVAGTKGSRRPVSSMTTYTPHNTRDRCTYHTQLANLTFGEILDLTAVGGVFSSRKKKQHVRILLYRLTTTACIDNSRRKTPASSSLRRGCTRHRRRKFLPNQNQNTNQQQQQQYCGTAASDTVISSRTTPPSVRCVNLGHTKDYQGGRICMASLVLSRGRGRKAKTGSVLLYRWASTAVLLCTTLGPFPH